MSEKERDIRRMSAAIAACRICVERPLPGRAGPLPHAPRPVAILSPSARILIAGQAPGLRVHDSGIPFKDASGERLRDWLGVTADEFYDASKFAILPMGFCFPGYDRHGSDLPPRKECAPAWRQAALDLMPQIELVLAIGGYAHAYHLGRRMAPVGATVMDFRAILASGTHPAVLPLPHPSWRNTGWLKANPWFADELLPLLRARVRAGID